MNFGPNHYMPVLKVKRNEKQALQAIAAPLQSRITPLLEIVERQPTKTLSDHLDTAFKDLATAVAPYRRCLLDTWEIEPDGSAGAGEVFRRAASAGITFTPVTGVSRTVDVAPALRHRGNGIALRLTRGEFESGRLAASLRTFMARHGLSHTNVDIIVDLGPVDQLVQTGVSRLATSFLNAVPDQSRWRTLTITGCAFPQGMGIVDRNSFALVERNEWKVWRNDLHANRQQRVRLPAYGDCGIQHPVGVEGYDPRIMPVSAAVRYTLDEDWLLIKGESRDTTPHKDQFPHLAAQLASGHLRRFFAGTIHCPGCASIKAAADGAPRFGSLGVWRRLGTIHHITTVMEAMGALTWL